jgi:hypothetical protein
MARIYIFFATLSRPPESLTGCGVAFESVDPGEECRKLMVIIPRAVTLEWLNPAD